LRCGCYPSSAPCDLYYRALRGTRHKWLDIAAMSAAALPPNCQIEAERSERRAKLGRSPVHGFVVITTTNKLSN